MKGERLFLHFLDREVSFLSGVEGRSVSDFIEIFKVCALHSYEQMVLSGGHLFEHPAAQNIFRIFPELFSDGQISPIANARTTREFIDLKSSQYDHTRDSNHRDYSIYFGSEWEARFGERVIFEFPVVDTTKALATSMLLDFKGDADDAKRIIDHINARNRRAITSELFENLVDRISDRMMWDVRFSISRNYQRIYRDNYAPKIFVGTGLVKPALETRLGSEYDFSIARLLYDNLNLKRMFRVPVFSFGQLRRSIEHTRYVETYRSIFHNTGIDNQGHVATVIDRVLPHHFRGRRVTIDIDTQLYAFANHFEEFVGRSFDEIYTEVTTKIMSTRSRNVKQAIEDFELSQSDKTDYQKPKIYLVIAAQKELIYAREFLRNQGYALSSEDTFADNKIGHTFTVLRENEPKQGGIPVALIRANQKGKAEMRSLLEAIDRYEDPSIVIMVGMMAGLRGKSKIFDVIAPRPVYDATNVSVVKGDELVVEPVPTYMDPALHNRVGNTEWQQTDESYIKLITDKVTVTVPGTFDSLTHELANQATSRDPENTVGLEMEASALSEMQRDQTQSRRHVRYLMIKGVADYAGTKIPVTEAQTLASIERIGAVLPENSQKEIDPRSTSELKEAFQREATERSLRIAIRIISKYSDL